MYSLITNACVFLISANVISASAGKLPRMTRNRISRVGVHQAPLKLRLHRFDVDDKYADIVSYRKRDESQIKEKEERLQKLDGLAELLLAAMNVDSKKEYNSELPTDNRLFNAINANSDLTANEVFDDNGMLFLTKPQENKETRDFNRLLNKVVKYNMDNEHPDLRQPDSEVFTDPEVEKIKGVVSGLAHHNLRSLNVSPDTNKFFKFSDLVL